MTLVEIMANLLAGTAEFLPNLIGAIILLVIGLVVGKIVGRVVKEVMERAKVDYYVHEKKKPTFKLANLFSVIARWWIYLAFITAALSREVLGITSLAVWMSEINAFIPRVVGAAIILVAAYVLGEYIKEHFKSTQRIWASLVGKITFFFIIYVAIAMALPILGIPTSLVSNILLIIVGSIGLGLAIAMGLGMKDAVSDISRRYARKMKV